MAPDLIHRDVTRNIVANVAGFVVSVAVGLLLTPYLMRHLGVSGYGLVPLAGMVTSYVAIITLGLNAGVGRFFTIALEEKNREESLAVFNTAFFSSTALVIVLFVPCTWLALQAGRMFVIPPEFAHEGSWLFAVSLIAFLIQVIFSTFEIVTYSLHRLEIRNALVAAGSLIRAGAIVVLFETDVPRLWHVSVAIGVAALFSAGGATLAWRKLLPEIVLNIRYWSWDVLRKLVRMGGWIVVNHIGTLLLISIDLVVINMMLGAEDAGKYAALLQWSGLMRGFALAFTGALGPAILRHFAHGEIQGIVRTSRSSVRILGLVLALPVGLISGFSEPLLLLWLGPEFASLGPLLSVMMIHLSLNLGYTPLTNIPIATGDVRIPGLVQVAAGMVNLCCALLFIRLGAGMYGVAFAGALVLTMRNLLFTPLYAAAVLGEQRVTFMKEVLPLSTATVLLFTGGQLLSWLLAPSSWWALILACLAISAAYAFVAWHALMNEEQRSGLLVTLHFRHLHG